MAAIDNQTAEPINDKYMAGLNIVRECADKDAKPFGPGLVF